MIYNASKHITNMSNLLKLNDFGEKLDRIIAEKGTNTYKLAKDMNVTHTTVERYINGYPPKKPYAIRLCFALGLSPEESMGLLASAGIVFSPNCNRDIVFAYIIENFDSKKITVTDVNILIDSLINENKNYKTKRKIDQIELI